jgi:lipoyl(octanoyl) transferase
VRVIEVRRLGLVKYGAALELQKRLVVQRKAGLIPDQLLLLQHPPVITLGVKSRDARANIVASDAELERDGVEIVETGRGGDVTFHGPGQLVGYPIIDLSPDRRDVHKYVRDLEEALIRTAAVFGVAAGRQSGLTGVWVGDNKLAAIGVRIARWITSHGFALNVSTDLEAFNLIVPCGISDKGVTSLAKLVNKDVSLADVEDAVVPAFAEIFDRRPLQAHQSAGVDSWGQTLV